MSITHLKEGDPAPAFEARDQNGEKVSLEDFRGKKVVLYFYPKDMTPGCTAEACDLADHYRDLLDQGYEVLGVSPDDEKSHRRFIDKHELPFDLLADPDKKILQAYGVWGEKKFMGKTTTGVHRTTFIIDEKGKIERVIKKVKTKEHAGQILQGTEA